MKKENNKKNNSLKFIKRTDVLIIAALVLVSLVALVLLLPRTQGAAAVVSVGTGEGTTTQKIPLNQSGIYNIEGVLPVTLEVKDGAISFINSQCADHTCESFGALGKEGDWALCAPAEVAVSVEE